MLSGIYEACLCGLCSTSVAILAAEVMHRCYPLSPASGIGLLGTEGMASPHTAVECTGEGETLSSEIAGPLTLRQFPSHSWEVAGSGCLELSLPLR